MGIMEANRFNVILTTYTPEAPSFWLNFLRIIVKKYIPYPSFLIKYLPKSLAAFFDKKQKAICLQIVYMRRALKVVCCEESYTGVTPSIKLKNNSCLLKFYYVIILQIPLYRLFLFLPAYKQINRMEQMIIFVYDTGFCQTEADDPQKAVLFFHPCWVSDQQRLALCGQLMGAAHFCSSLFSTPKVLTLQCGKFVLKKFGRYILSVGSDQILPEWILQERFNTLEMLLQFYHNSFDSIFIRAECDQEEFSKRLTEIFKIYIPILQFIICAFGNVFVVRCPKKSSSAFLKAFQLLEACCNFNGVLGGVILHNSRVIASQLDPDITKLLALTDKFHIRTCAEHIQTPFHLPVGVQLVKIYLKQKMYEALHKAVNMKNSTFNGIQKKIIKKAEKGIKKKKASNKADSKKIFTVHEEEDGNLESSPKIQDSVSNSKELTRYKSKKSKTKLENNTLKERSKSFVGYHNLKVCSTPTVEKTLIHEELLSICNSGKTEQKPTQQTNFVPDIVKDAIKSKNRSRMLPTTIYYNNKLHRVSMDDLMIDLTKKSYPVPLRYYCFGLSNTYKESDHILETEGKNKKRIRKKHLYKTIADPINPVFRYDGLPVSKSLYNNCLEEHYKDYIMANLTIDSREEFLKSKFLENQNFKLKTDVCLKIMESKIPEETNSKDAKAINEANPVEDIPKSSEEVKEKKMLSSTNQKTLRRSLSLPLKPLFTDTTEDSTHKVLNTRTPTTPLTTKLSLLTFEEQNTDVIPLLSTGENSKLKSILKNVSIEKKEDSQSDTVGSGLFVCGYQDMTILLILDESVEKIPDLILSLWETSLAALKVIENLRNKSMANISNNNNSSYSFLSMDSHWGTVQRSGPWGDEELKIIGSLHQDLVNFSNITEIIIRNEDSVIYGYSCGGTEIFYQQGGCSSAGLPTPADLMGVVTLKARRRLERDRDIVLL